MRQALIGAFVALLCSLAANPVPANELFSQAKIPEAFGVNIHFTHPRDGEMQMLTASGVRWVRMDLTWDSTEKIKGQYDFSAYDHLVQKLSEAGLRAHFILDYGNPLYDDGLPPRSDEARRAFANWATATAQHFAGNGFLWEIWNEPNIELFWKPKPDPKDYLLLFKAVAKKFKTELPNEILVAPALSRMDWKYMKTLFQGGLLEDIDVFSIHPYREGKAPETFFKDLKKIRAWVQKYAPAGKQIPIISGEWGYPTIAGDVDEKTQASYLIRMWLGNLSQGIPHSIWYDWHDDGPDAHEREHHFGWVKFPYHENRSPVFDPKPAYEAAQFLNSHLAGFQFDGREDAGRNKDYLLRFRQGENLRWVYWTTSHHPKLIKAPLEVGRYLVQDLSGKKLKVLYNSKPGLGVVFKSTPQYLTPQ